MSKNDHKNELANKKEKTTDQKSIQLSLINTLINDCKKDWDIARLKKCEKNKREEAIIRIIDRLKGNYTKALRKRTGSRIFQTIFKYGSVEIKDAVFNEIKKDIPDLMNCSFSIFFLQKLLLTKYFLNIIEIVNKNYKKIITDRVGAFFLDEIYQKMKDTQKEEFFKAILGNKISVFHSNKKISEITQNEFNFEDIIRKLLDKGLTNLEYTHDMIYLHIHHFSKQEDKTLYIKGLVEFFIDFLHTEKGKYIAEEILKDQTNQKKVVKQVGQHLQKLIESDPSVLIKIIKDCDEKEVQKYILKPIKGNIDTFCNTQNFHLFVDELIKNNLFDYLKEKFIKEVNKKGYSEELNKIALQQMSSD